MQAIHPAEDVGWSRVWPIVLRCIGVIIAIELFFTGLWVRQQVWEACAQIHYRGDLNQGHRHGNRIIGMAIDAEADAEGATVPRWSGVFRAYLGYYDWVIAAFPDGRLDLDYPPLRLMVMTVWSRLIYVPGMAVEDYDFNRSAQLLLNVNTCAEVLAAFAAFLLVRQWVAVGQPPGSRSERAWMCGLAAALLIWFDPSLIVDAHGWPQWDAWLVPFYLFAAWAASTNRWFAAGVILGIGGAAKGQLWVTAPVFFLWPIFAWRWGGFLRVVLGFLFGIACIQAIWTLSISSAQLWIGGCGVALLVAASGKTWLRGRWRMAASGLAAVLVLFPWLTLQPDWTSAGALALAAAIVLTAWRIPKRLMGMGCCVLLAGAIFLASVHYDASFGWFKVGIVYGASRNERHMFAGVTNNLPAILVERYGWYSPNENVTSVTLHGTDYPITIGNVLEAIYLVSLVLCACGLAMHSRRKSPRALLALAAPWVLFYALMPQMHERYLLWGGVISAIGIGVGAGPVLLHIVVTLFALDTILQVMMSQNSDSQSGWLYTLIQGMHPDSGWAVLLCAAIFLYWAVVPLELGGCVGKISHPCQQYLKFSRITRRLWNIRSMSHF